MEDVDDLLDGLEDEDEELQGETVQLTSTESAADANKPKTIFECIKK